MKRIVICSILTLSIPYSIACKGQSLGSDTIAERSHDIKEIVVTGTRNATDVRHLSQTVSVISRQKIEASIQPSILPILTEQTPGLFTTSRGVMGFGVSGGAAGSISLRGLSGGNARIMVLIDGHPQYAGIFGHPIADAYQSLIAEKVEVIKGPASVLYGSNAMGGVINIVTRKMETEGIKTHAHAGYGSYNTLETELTNRIKWEKLESVVGVSYNRTDGHRANMDFEQLSGYGKIGYQIDKKWHLRADVNVTHFNASCPGPTSAPLEEGDQRITRGVTSFSLENSYNKTSGALSFFYNWGKHWINDGYTPSNGETPQDGRFNSKDNMMGASAYQSISFFNGNRVTVGIDWFRYGGKAWTKYVKGEREGSKTDLVDKHEDEWAVYADFRQDLSYWLTANIGVRVDHHSRIGTEIVPQSGLAFHVPQDIEIKVSAAKGFRYPTLREMYMFPPQNPDLKPESMWNFEISIAQHLIDSRLTYGANIFFIDGENIIETLPNPNGSGRLNQNSGKIKNCGIETQASYKLCKFMTVEANYSLLHMNNPVIAAPKHKLYIGATFNHGRLNATTGLQHIAGLYTSVSPNKKENFLLWNIRASVHTTNWLDIWLKGENLLAQKYEINAGYPMPRMTAMGGIRIKI